MSDDNQRTEEDAKKAAEDSKPLASGGIGLGSAIAVTISWSVNKSILWAILHGVFSWLYVIYYAIVR
jgi:hypothetical protein